VTKANSDGESFVHNFQTKRVCKQKKQACLRLSAILERQIKFTMFDFWLPLRRYDMAKREQASISYEQPTIF
jgi:hypothetical protein